MSDVSCPRCGDSFRVPDVEIPEGAVAKCPWCMDVFPVSRLISTLPPMVQLIDASGQPLSLGQSQAPLAAGIRWEGEDAVPGPPAASELADRADDEPVATDDSYLLSDELSDPATQHAEETRFAAFDAEAVADQPPEASFESQFDEGQSDEGQFDRSFELTHNSAEADFAAPVEPRPLHDVSAPAFGREERGFVAGPRAKKKAGSPIKSILGIVAGGLLAIPLTAGILALVGRPLNLGFWPFDGRTIAMGSANRSAAPVMPQEADSRPAPRQGRSLANDLPAARDAVVEDDGPLSDPQVAAAALPGTANGAGQRDRGFSMPRSTGPELIVPVIEDDDATAVDQTADTRGDGAPRGAATQDSVTADPTAREPGTAEPIARSAAVEPATVEPETDPETAASAEAPDLLAADESSMRDPAPAPQSDPAAADADAAREPAADPPTVAAEDSAAPDATTLSDSPAVVEITEPAQPRQRASSAELQAALDAADAALQAVMSYDEDDVSRLRRRLSVLFAGVAAVAEIAKPQDQPELDHLVDRLIDADLIKNLAPAAPGWVRLPERPNGGMLAVGPLRRNEDRWFLDWSGPQPLEVRLVDGAAVEEHPEVLVLGRLLTGDSAPAVEAILLRPLE